VIQGDPARRPLFGGSEARLATCRVADYGQIPRLARTVSLSAVKASCTRPASWCRDFSDVERGNSSLRHCRWLQTNVRNAPVAPPPALDSPTVLRAQEYPSAGINRMPPNYSGQNVMSHEHGSPR